MAGPHNAIGRRALITSRLLEADQVAPPGGEIASILVLARPAQDREHGEA